MGVTKGMRRDCLLGPQVQELPWRAKLRPRWLAIELTQRLCSGLYPQEKGRPSLTQGLLDTHVLSSTAITAKGEPPQ